LGALWAIHQTLFHLIREFLMRILGKTSCAFPAFGGSVDIEV